MNIGYNDLNTYAPQPFITQGPVVISGGGRPKKAVMKPAVMSPPEHFKIQGAGVQDDVEKAMKQLKSFMNGTRKTKLPKKVLDLLEKEGIISKVDEMSGGINRLKKANRWRDFSNDTVRMGIDTASYGYDKYQQAVNPVKTQGKKLVTKIFGGDKPKKKESQWVMFVKDFAQKHNIPYKQALKDASPHYKKLKGSGYSRVN